MQSGGCAQNKNSSRRVGVAAARKLKWWARQGSNLQPDGYEPPALTIELRAPPFVDASDNRVRQALRVGEKWPQGNPRIAFNSPSYAYSWGHPEDHASAALSSTQRVHPGACRRFSARKSSHAPFCTSSSICRRSRSLACRRSTPRKCTRQRAGRRPGFTPG